MIHKGTDLSVPFLSHFFHKNMEFLWNFGCVFAVGVPVRRGNEPWGVGEKAQNVEIKIMENI